MKNLLAIFVFALAASTAAAQQVKDLDKFIALGRFMEADAAVTAYMANPKTSDKAVGWYYRGLIDYNLSNDSTLPAAQSLAKKTSSFEAYKKYQAMDPKAENLAGEKYRPFLLLYAGFFDLGAASFNKGEFKNSYAAFAKALEAEEYAVSRGYSYDEIKFTAFDTALIKNTAMAASRSGDTTSAMKYYAMFPERNIAGADNRVVYQVLLDHFISIKDKVTATKYLKTAQQLYPQDKDVWSDYSLRLVSKEDKAALYAEYDKIIADNPKNFPVAYNYSVELYNSLYASGETRPADIAGTRKKLTELLNIAIPNDTSMDALMLMTNHLFNITAEYSVEESTEKVAAKKVEKNKKTVAAANAVIPYAEKVIQFIDAKPQTSVRNRADKKNVLGFLMDIYSIKGDAKKSAEYDKLRREVKIQ